MLARIFLTAEDLRITEAQHDALIKTLRAFERGDMKYVSIYCEGDPDSLKFDGLFNMEVWHARYECGTVACIGGTAELLSGQEDLFDPIRSTELDDLLYPRGVDWARLTEVHAETALRNYLTTGSPRWIEVCGR